jgi:hypothetical protein
MLLVSYLTKRERSTRHGIDQAEIVVWFLPWWYLHSRSLTSGNLLVFLDPREWRSLPELPVGHVPTSVFEWMTLPLSSNG